MKPIQKPNDPAGWPRRLRDANDAVGVGSIMRKYARHLEGATDDEPLAFARTKAALHRRTARRLIWATGALAGAGAVAVVLWFTVIHAPPLPPVRPQRPQVASSGLPAPVPVPLPSSTPALPTTPPPSSSSVPVPSSPPAPSIRLGPRAIALAAGRIELEGQASVLVARSAKAVARSERGNATIRLDDGRVDLHVRPQAPGHSFSVAAGPFNFVVIGTAFSVRRQRDRVTLVVTEGRVAVVRGTRTLALVTLGQTWTGQIADALPDSGPDSDLAAYEAARRLKDDVGDLERARIAFQSYRARFPQGALRVEAALSLVEILPRLGRHQEALGEAARLLNDPAAAPRQTEIHLLRGNIFRLALGDLTAAADEYRAAARGDGKAADEARRRLQALSR